mmetsp:Transcript_16068/g.36140  ORF Transcript_16068/g.36140 Transcript_16068/m.36140 type:complete len:247 (-) Transcript_16068:725-1465(-)
MSDGSPPIDFLPPHRVASSNSNSENNNFDDSAGKDITDYHSSAASSSDLNRNNGSMYHHGPVGSVPMTIFEGDSSKEISTNPFMHPHPYAYTHLHPHPIPHPHPHPLPHPHPHLHSHFYSHQQSTSTNPRDQQSGKSTKGLKHFSREVCRKVEEKGRTTYNEVADEIVAEVLEEKVHVRKHDENNIRRRVYDALNVLMAVGIISREKKMIRWEGLPNSARPMYDLESLKVRRGVIALYSFFRNVAY